MRVLSVPCDADVFERYLSLSTKLKLSPDRMQVKSTVSLPSSLMAESQELAKQRRILSAVCLLDFWFRLSLSFYQLPRHVLL